MAKRERGTGGLVKIKGCRFWYAQIYDKYGKQRRTSTKSTVKQEAQSFLRNLLTDKDRGVQFVGDLNKIRYGDLRAALLQNYVEKGNKSLQVMEDGAETIWGLKALDEFFQYEPASEGKPEKPGMPVRRITTDTAREFAKKRLAEGAANDTVNGSLALLRRMLSIAHEDGKIQVKPKIRLLKHGTPRKGFLALADFNKLLSHIPPRLKPLITFLYYCGVRLGEAKQIEWSQVNLNEALIRLEGEQTKNSEPRTIPLPDVLVAMLKKLPKDGPVFDAANLRKEWYKACAAAGLGTLTEVEGKPDPRYNGLIIHDLRRSAIKNLMKAGVNEKVAMSISGHKTRDVFDRYNIVDEQDVVEAMRRVQQIAPPTNLVPDGEKSVKTGRLKRRQKLLIAAS
jgi:integrase